MHCCMHVVRGCLDRQNVHAKGSQVDENTVHITTIQMFRRYIFPVIFRDLLIELFEHPSGIVDRYDGSIRIGFFDFGRHGTAATGVVKDCKGRAWGQGLRRLNEFGSQHSLSFFFFGEESKCTHWISCTTTG